MRNRSKFVIKLIPVVCIYEVNIFTNHVTILDVAYNHKFLLKMKKWIRKTLEARYRWQMIISFEQFNHEDKWFDIIPLRSNMYGTHMLRTSLRLTFATQKLRQPINSKVNLCGSLFINCIKERKMRHLSVG